MREGKEEEEMGKRMSVEEGYYWSGRCEIHGASGSTRLLCPV